ncbi:MAG: hypothetical protein M3R25_07805 [Bacteroidota bacterium]|nr:hypothetical protein [Bacteroidota bacterium]
MDQTKAQRLLHKIQAFLDNGNGQELSRLEKDLIKSYIVQLYDAVSFESSPPAAEMHKQENYDYKKSQEDHFVKTEQPVTKTSEVVKEHVYQLEPPNVEYYKPEPPKVEYHKPEPPKVEYHQPEPPEVEPIVPVNKEYVAPVINEEPVDPKQDYPVYVHTPSPPEHKPYQYQHSEPVKETVKESVQVSNRNEEFDTDQQQVLSKIFDQQKSDEMSHRFNQAPIPSIVSAMGLNERIFTLNELFGGDKMLFDNICQKLNGLHSLDEARQVLMNGPARDYKWADAERIKMAEQFIRIVARRYYKIDS